MEHGVNFGYKTRQDKTYYFIPHTEKKHISQKMADYEICRNVQMYDVILSM